MKMRKNGAEILSLVLVALLGFVLIFPIILSCISGFRIGGEWNLFFLKNVFEREIYISGFLKSLEVAFSVTFFCLILSLPLSFLLSRCSFAGKKIIEVLLYAPVVLPPFVGAIGIKKFLSMDGGGLNIILSKIGLIDITSPPNWLGEHIFAMVVLLEVLHLYPVMLLNIQTAISNVDPSLEESARNLGANSWKVFSSVTLPLTMPGIFAGGAIVFIWSFTELGTPLMFDWTEVTPVQVFRGLQSIDMKPQPYVLVMFMLIVSGGIYLLGKHFFGKTIETYGGKSGGERQIRKLGKAGTFFALIACCGIIFVSLLPHVFVFFMSISGSWHFSILPEKFTLSHHLKIFSKETALLPIINSLKYSSICVLLDLLIGIPSAYIIARSKARSKVFLDILTMLPLAVPGIVMAFGYLAMTRPGMPFSIFDPRTSNPTILIAVAYAVRRLPFVVRGCSAGIAQVPVVLEESARVHGAKVSETLSKITLPLIMANIVASSVLTFSFAMLEVSDSLILAYWQEDYPVPKAIWEISFQLQNGENIACALGVWFMLLLTVALLFSRRIMGKRLSLLFRA